MSPLGVPGASTRGGEEMDMAATIKIKDDISPVLQKITENLQRSNDLLAENKTLLEQVLHCSFEVV